MTQGVSNILMQATAGAGGYGAARWLPAPAAPDPGR
jgi:hypothetical protein